MIEDGYTQPTLFDVEDEENFTGVERFVDELRGFLADPTETDEDEDDGCPCGDHDCLCADCDDAGLGECLGEDGAGIWATREDDEDPAALFAAFDAAVERGETVLTAPPACVCGFPAPEDSSLAHILAHNAGEVAGAVTVDWSRAHGEGDHPVPYLFVVKDVTTGERLYPVRVTIMSDSAASLAVVDVTELINADGAPIRSNTSGKLGVHTEAYKAWAYRADKAPGDVFQGDKYITVVNRFVLASDPAAPTA